jgi:GNAT superfamily N-acetyltransferase
VIREIRQYGKIVLLDIEDVSPSDWLVNDATNIRVRLPSSPEHEIRMFSRGFLLADRTIGASINVNRCSLDLDKLIRMNIEVTSDHKDNILEIAKSGFTYDRRFHILPECNMHVAELILDEWVALLGEYLVCIYKDNIVGFIALKKVEDDTLFIHLAAVLEKYRSAGVAMSLYAKALQIARDQGYKKLKGRISTLNMPALNIYSFLGANFYEPEDIFLKELQ